MTLRASVIPISSKNLLSRFDAAPVMSVSGPARRSLRRSDMSEIRLPVTVFGRRPTARPTSPATGNVQHAKSSPALRAGSDSAWIREKRAGVRAGQIKRFEREGGVVEPNLLLALIAAATDGISGSTCIPLISVGTDTSIQPYTVDERIGYVFASSNLLPFCGLAFRCADCARRAKYGLDIHQRSMRMTAAFSQ